MFQNEIIEIPLPFDVIMNISSGGFINAHMEINFTISKIRFSTFADIGKIVQEIELHVFSYCSFNVGRDYLYIHVAIDNNRLADDILYLNTIDHDSFQV